MKRMLVSLCLMALVSSCSNVLMDVYDERSGESSSLPKITMTIDAVPNVVVPVRGATPVTTAIETDQYTGTITWSPGDSPFASSTVYTATIVLTAKSRYTLKGVTQNFFTVAGATSVTNDANSGTVTAVFPATGVPADVDVVFQSAAQTGGATGTADSTALTLTFDVDPSTLAASDITVTGATKGALSGSGTTRSLAISDITVANAASVTVTVTSPSGYAITGSPRTATVYRYLYVGMSYLGGKIAYVSSAHGLIAATADQSSGIIWALAAYQSTAVPDGTSDAYGSGYSNTTNIIAQNGSGTGYAAGLCRAYGGGGYSDWFLPNVSELDLLRDNKTAIGGFSDTLYWTSYSSGADSAKACNFADSSVATPNKSTTRRVRACRYF